MIHLGVQSYPAFRGVIELNDALVAHDVDMAVWLCEKISQAYKERAEIWSLCATVALLNLDLERNEYCLKKAISLDPSNFQYYYRFAVPQMPLLESVEQIRMGRTKMKHRLNLLEKRAGKFSCPYPNPNEIFLQNNRKLLDVQHMCSINFFNVYHGENDREINEQICRIFRKVCPILDRRADHVGRVRRPGERLRLGIVSKHMYNHTIGSLFGEFLMRLPSARFHKTLVMLHQVKDATTEHFEGNFDKTISIDQTLQRTAQRIADERFDVILYPDIGMNSFTSFLSMMRLATAQCVTWGHPVTTGIDTMDTFLSIDDLEVDSADHYSERVLTQTLANLYFTPPIVVDCTRADFSLPEDKNIYGCPQTLVKFHPLFDSILVEILRRDPNGYIVLLGSDGSEKSTIIARIRAASPELAERFLWVSSQSRSRYLALIKCFDVMLDPYPFGGGNTVLESFSVLTPVITLPPVYARGRLCYAFYRQCGFEELIATDVEDYISLALRLTREPEFREHAVRCIERGNPRLFRRDEAVLQFGELLSESYRYGLDKIQSGSR
ncbi:MAG: hypothetical protein VX278_14005 [Myxococcota bacterium]|nr:hypothetical protein [Myxococcota bacterium]